MKGRRLTFLFVSVFFLFSGTALCEEEEFQCEVLSLEGSATVTGADGVERALKQGDLLKAGDQVGVGEDGYADLAYDRDWQNITRVEAKSKLRISSIEPAKLDLREGGVFAKLRKLPQDSSFEVKTPTAVATVRGTEYRTTFLDGKTDVFNASASKIYVCPVAEDGSPDRDNTVILREDKKTSIEAPGKPPVEPVDMTPEEKEKGETFIEAIQRNIETAVTEKRESRIQTVTQIEEFIREKKRAARAQAALSEPELSRVTDERRRSFGGDNALAPPAPPAEKETTEPEEPAAPAHE